jgi:Zn-dependent protease
MDCRRCFGPLESEALACPRCHAFVYEDELNRLKSEAQAAETAGHFSLARDKWVRMLSHLPADTKQAAWVMEHLAELQGVDDTNTPPETSAAPSWLARLGPLAPLLLILFKGKGLLALFNAKSLLSLGAFVGFYGSEFGWAFGAGFAVLILIHEMGHYIDIRRRGLPADMPVFLPGLGAYVRWRAMGVDDVVRAEVSLAGPLAGALAAWACAGLWIVTDAPLWAALARAGAWLNIMNLIPVWALDGGQAARVLDRSHRLAIASLAVVLWLLFHEAVFVLVAAGALWRTFTGEAPSRASTPLATYFCGLLISLGLSMWLMPGSGAGLP